MSQQLIRYVAPFLVLIFCAQTFVKWGVDSCLPYAEGRLFPTAIAPSREVCKFVIDYDAKRREENASLYQRRSLTSSPFALTYLREDNFGPFDLFFFWRTPHDWTILLAKIPGSKSALAKLLVSSFLLSLVFGFLLHYAFSERRGRHKRIVTPETPLEVARRQSASRSILPAYQEMTNPKPVQFTTRPQPPGRKPPRG